MQAEQRKCEKYLTILATIIILVPAVAFITYPGQSTNGFPALESPYNGFGPTGHSQTSFKNNQIPLVPSNVLNYTSVEVTNSQGIPTPVPFDLEVMVDSYALLSYESPGLCNVEWFSTNGTIIPSWIQCNVSAVSTCTIYWLKLNFSIPAHSSASVFMGFAKNLTNLMRRNPHLEGAAPQASQNYSEYDNGKYVFPFYCDFSSTSFNSSWTTLNYSTANVSLHDGLVIQDSYGDAYAYAISKQPVTQPEIIETLVTEDHISTGDPNIQGVGISTSKNLTNHLVYDGTPYYYYFQGGYEVNIFNNQYYENVIMPSENFTQISPDIHFQGSPLMVGVGWTGNSTQYWYLNGKTAAVTHNTSIQSGSFYPNIGMTSGGSGAGVLKIPYIRGRYMPPNNVMPAVQINYPPTGSGHVYFTVSGVPSSDTWYINISGMNNIVEHGTLSFNMTMPPGIYHYNVSTYYNGSGLYGTGTFQVENNSGTFVLIVFTPKSAVVRPSAPPMPLPPETYAMVAEILILIGGAFLILVARTRRLN